MRRRPTRRRDVGERKSFSLKLLHKSGFVLRGGSMRVTASTPPWTSSSTSLDFLALFCVAAESGAAASRSPRTWALALA
jgi:hypothetical protein